MDRPARRDPGGAGSATEFRGEFHQGRRDRLGGFERQQVTGSGNGDQPRVGEVRQQVVPQHLRRFHDVLFADQHRDRVPLCWHLDEPVLPLALMAADHLGREHSTAVRVPRLGSPPLLAHLLAALVLRVLPVASAPGIPLPAQSAGVFASFRAAVEEHFADWHQVADYAGALGYDRRTLARATRAATGAGAKQFLDQRILLEAKRLLAHTDLPVGGCARALGFRDAANFTTFFQRGAGMPPSVWRADPAEGGTARPAPNGSKRRPRA